MSKEEIKVVECNTVAEAEAEYFLLREEGCWQVIKPLKIVWSWKKMKNVAMFSVKRVGKRYDLEDHMKAINKCIQKSMEVLPTIVNIFSERNKRKALQKLLQNKP